MSGFPFCYRDARFRARSSSELTMALPESATLKPNAVPAYFDAMLDAQPPDRFTVKFIENLGFTSTNDRLFIGILTINCEPCTPGKDRSRHRQHRQDIQRALRVCRFLSARRCAGPSSGANGYKTGRNLAASAEPASLPVSGLQYHINIVLPDTRDQAVYDAIFRSLREHLG